MLRIAVTGGIACGKSLLGSVMRECGVEVCDADDLAHKFLAESAEVRVSLVDEFGDGILNSAGLIDRNSIADIVFNSAASMEKLTAILHPLIRDEWISWLQSMEAQEDAVGTPCMACVIVPLLYEANMSEGWDAVICVAASEQECIRRLQKRGDTHYNRRMVLQMPVSKKASCADYVIYNGGNETSLRDQWKRIYNSIMENKS